MSELMKVLFVIDSLGRGGTERSLAEMLPHFMHSGIMPVIACFNTYPDGVEAQVRKLGVNVRSLNGGWLSRVHSLRSIGSREGPDLIVTSLLRSDVLGRVASIGRRAPLMSSLPSTPYHPVRFEDPAIRATQLRRIRMIDSWTARHLTTHFHAVSHSVKQAAVDALAVAPERITVVERGRDPERLGTPGPERRREARRMLGLTEYDRVIVNAGRHEYAKGQNYLIEAVAELVRRKRDVVLLLAGRQGAVTQELTRLVNERELDSRVRFLGHRDDVPNILAAADLFVFPSLYEGLPGAVIEAMALGLPIVGSDIPPLREVVEADRNALLVPPRSVSELANAIENLIQEKDVASAFGRRSREIFEERFTIGRSASRMVDLMRRVAAMRE